ncbi:unnamed protein product [Alopecurus aequalis]
MNKRNVYLKDSSVDIPLQLVLNHFKDKATKATIQLDAPDNCLYSVGASKHTDDRAVLDSGWDFFVASQHIQEKDLLIFRSMEDSLVKVQILDPSGHEKTSSRSVTGSPSSTQETSGGSLNIVDPPPPPPHPVTDLSSSDEDEIVREGMGKSCRPQTHSCAKTQKMSSTSSPCTKSGSGGRKQHDLASVEKLGTGSQPQSSNLGGPSQRPYIFPESGTPLSQQAKKKIEEKVQVIGSEVPIYVKAMTLSSIFSPRRPHCKVGFCAEYALAHLPEESTTVLLQVDGKQAQWQTTMEVRPQDNWRFIYIGWKEFAMQNGLEVGDICLFKLTSKNTGSLTMKVHLIRKSEMEA